MLSLPLKFISSNYELLLIQFLKLLVSLMSYKNNILKSIHDIDLTVRHDSLHIALIKRFN